MCVFKLTNKGREYFATAEPFETFLRAPPYAHEILDEIEEPDAVFDKHYTLLLRQEKLAEMKGDGKRLPDSHIPFPVMIRSSNTEMTAAYARDGPVVSGYGPTATQVVERCDGASYLVL